MRLEWSGNSGQLLSEFGSSGSRRGPFTFVLQWAEIANGGVAEWRIAEAVTPSMDGSTASWACIRMARAPGGGMQALNRTPGPGYP